MIIEKIGRVTSKSVLKCTGKDWAYWVRVLTESGAKNWTHGEIAKFLKTKYKLTPWWQQMVAHGFEVYTGKRVEGQSLKGEYATVATKTFPVTAKAAWALLTSPKGQKLWLGPMTPIKFKPKATYEIHGGIFGEVRTMLAGRRARMTWQETEWAKPTIINLLVVPRPGGKSVVVIQHDNLPTTAIKAQMLAHWKTALDALIRSIHK